MPYRVSSYDTYGAPEDWSGGVLGTFESYEEAVAEAKSSVDADLEECLRQALAMPHTGVDTPQRLASYYANSWERVSITAVDPSPEVEPGFDQFAYALKSAENLFATTDAARSLKEGGQKIVEAERKMLAGLIERAESGESDASLELSRWYEKGGMYGEYKIHEEVLALHRREATDKDESERWFRLAADQGDAHGQFNLGDCYRLGDGVAQDEVEAVRWYRRAAKQGHADAQYSLGVMYAEGEGVAQDDAKAAQWYRRAAKQGHALGQVNLGAAYGTGAGVAQDEGEAERLYRLAAAQEEALAQYNLGWMHEKGRGVSQDDTEAVRWYRLAAKQGHTEAQDALDRLEPKQGGAEESRESAVFNIDEDPENADWTKQTFDLAHGTVDQIREQMLKSGWTRERLDLFKRTNTGFKLAVRNRPELEDL